MTQAARALVALLTLAACRGRARPADDAAIVRDAPAVIDAAIAPPVVPPGPLALARIDVKSDAPAIDTAAIAAAVRAGLYASGEYVGPDQPGTKARARITVGATVRPAAGRDPAQAVVAIEAAVDLPGTEEPTLRAQVAAARPIARRADPAQIQRGLAETVAAAVAVDLVAREHARLAPVAELAAMFASQDEQAVAWALELAGARRAQSLVKAIVPLVRRPEPVGPAAVAALVAIGDPSAMSGLADAVDFNDPVALGIAIEAAVALGGPDANDFLELIANHHDPRLAARAKDGLARIKRREAGEK
ncbi:MAG: hypothetical protein K8W52_29395 [Deltaproteobacteria bacterium]|nr:hypothetical protein [Deltaproteobacteria bacterium]